MTKIEIACQVELVESLWHQGRETEAADAMRQVESKMHAIESSYLNRRVADVTILLERPFSIAVPSSKKWEDVHDAFQKSFLIWRYAQCAGNKDRLAKELDVTKGTLARWFKHHCI